MTKEFVPDLSRCRTAEQLGVALGVGADVLIVLSSQSAPEFYERHRIPKRSPRRKNEFREVYEPQTDELKQFHKTLNRRLSLFARDRDPAFPPQCCFGFVRGRSTLENAKIHCGAPLLLRADIEDFFPSIPAARVAAALASIGIPVESAALLSNVLCFTGALVAGLSASPMVSNLICRSLDTKLTKFADEAGAAYTRYADDLAFSGSTLPSTHSIASVVESEGFRLSTKKIRATKLGQAHFVTGLSITDPIRPHVPKWMKRNLRQEIFYASKHSVEDHLLRRGDKIGQGINRIDGLVRYVSFVERGTKYDFREVWDHLQSRDDIEPTTGPDHGRPRRTYYAVVDETYFEFENRRYIAVGFSAYEDPLAIETPITAARDRILADPFVEGRKDVMDRRGLHYSDLSRTSQRDLVSLIPRLPSRTLVGLTQIDHSKESDEDGYRRVFQWGFFRMCARSDRGDLVLYVERSSVTRPEFEKLADSVYQVLSWSGKKHPIAVPRIEIVGKVKVAVSLVDTMLGVLRHYIESATPDAPDRSTRAMDFERVRDRFAVIHDLDSRRYFSRKNPFTPMALRSE